MNRFFQKKKRTFGRDEQERLRNALTEKRRHVWKIPSKTRPLEVQDLACPTRDLSCIERRDVDVVWYRTCALFYFLFSVLRFAFTKDDVDRRMVFFFFWV